MTKANRKFIRDAKRKIQEDHSRELDALAREKYKAQPVTIDPRDERTGEYTYDL